MKNILKEIKDFDISVRNYLKQNSSFNAEELNMTQCQIICYLDQHEKVTQSELADFLKIRKSSVTGALVSLEEKGLIVRVESEEDRRHKYVMLSKKTIIRNTQVAELFENTSARLLSGIQEEELSVFMSVLEKMKHNLEVKE